MNRHRLLKKQQIKQLEVKKTNKEMTKAYSTISLGAKRLRWATPVKLLTPSLSYLIYAKVSLKK